MALFNVCEDKMTCMSFLPFAAKSQVSAMIIYRGRAQKATVEQPSTSHGLIHPISVFFFVMSLPPCVCAQLFTCTEGTPDCERRHRLPGVRRFNTLLTTLSESSNLNRLPLEQCHTLGVRSIAIIGEAPVGSSTFVIDTGARTSQSQRARGKIKNTHDWASRTAPARG